MSNLAAQLQKASQLSQTNLALRLGVSRQTYHKWLKGRAMKPEHKSAVEKLLKEYQPYTINYTIVSVEFTCRCNTNHILRRRSFDIEASGLFCHICHEHHWINWDEGILKHQPCSAILRQ